MARHYWVNRTICDVLEEMRQCWETRNFAHLRGLVEEAQSMANSMEAALEDKRDIKAMHEEWSALKAEIEALRKERLALKNELGQAVVDDTDIDGDL